MRILLGTLVLAAMAGTVFLSTRPAVDHEAWVIYECNDLAMVVFVKTDDTVEGTGIVTAEDVATSLERVHRIPVQRRYFIAVARYCPYTKRST